MNPHFQSLGCEADSFELLELRGCEALGQPYAFELTLASRDPRIDPLALLRSPACLRLRRAQAGPPELPELPYHGLLEHFEQLHPTPALASARSPAHTLYRARLVPRLQRLALCRHSRSFTIERPVPHTLRQILLDSGIHPLRMALRGSYRPRNFLCQYDESDLDFLHRWMQREGLFYLFEQGPHAESLLLIDHNELLPHDSLDIPWQPLPAAHDSSPSLHDWHARMQPLPRQLLLHRRNHRKADCEISVRLPLDPDGLGELVLDHIDLRDHDEALHYARVLAQQLRCRAQTFTARSSCLGMRCGQTLRLHGHPRADFNRPYLLTRITHHATRSHPALPGLHNAYSCQLELIDLALPFRPQPTVAWPRMPSSVGATVLADPDNPYAELDPHGRYAVRLHFDPPPPAGQPPKPPARLRMATPYAGRHHGLSLPLLAGTEVLVGFLDSDPDQPLITAAVPTRDNPSLSLQSNPYAHHLRTAGGNALCLDDRLGRQALRLHSPSSNSSLSLGAANPDDDSSGVHITTEGDDRSLVVGDACLVTGGVVDQWLLGSSSSLQLGPSTCIDLLGSAECSLDYGVQWNAGPVCEISAARWQQQAVRAEMMADDAVLASAGLGQAEAAEVLALRGRAQAAILLNAAAQAAAGAAAAALTALRSAQRAPSLESAATAAAESATGAASSLLACRVAFAAMQRILRIGSQAHRARLRLDAASASLRQTGENPACAGQLELDASGARLAASDASGSVASLLAIDDRGVRMRSGDLGIALGSEPARIELGIEDRVGLWAQAGQTGLQAGVDTRVLFLDDESVTVSAATLRIDAQRIDLP